MLDPSARANKINSLVCEIDSGWSLVAHHHQVGFSMVLDFLKNRERCVIVPTFSRVVMFKACNDVADHMLRTYALNLPTQTDILFLAHATSSDLYVNIVSNGIFRFLVYPIRKRNEVRT